MSEQNDQKLYIGIDLGTSNTEITVIQGDQVITLPITQNRTLNGRLTFASERLPSLVCFDDDGTPMFGEVYRQGNDVLSDYSGRTIFNTKRMLLGRPETKVYHIPKKDGSVDLYSPQDIAQLLLTRCAEEARRQKNYQSSDLVTISVPCGYQMDQVQATIRAARGAGFHIEEDVELITEPVAALVEYIKDQNPKYSPDDPRYIDTDIPQNILVYDLGGGTLDLSVVRVEKIGDVFHFTELANNNGERDRTIGGADFDTLVGQTLCRHLLESAAASRGCTVEDICSRLERTSYASLALMQELLHARAYDMKHTLSRKYAEVNPIDFYDEDDTSLIAEPIYVTLGGGVINGVESLNYTEIVQDFLTPGTSRNILDPIPSVLDAALLNGCKLPVSQVTKILITGGMCNFQPVRQALASYLEQLSRNKEQPICLHILESDAGLKAVSVGAAYSHTLKIENHNESLSNRYYLDVANGLPQDLITRGVYRPISLLNPTEALFEIYCGTSLFDPDMRKQYYYHHRFSPPLNGSAEITFYLKQEKSGEASLIGTIRRPGMENVEICFDEQSADSIEAPDALSPSSVKKNPYAASLLDLLGIGPNNYPMKPAYQGNSQLVQSAPEGTEKRLFLNSSSNHDHSVSDQFRSILQMMDIDDQLGTYSPFAGSMIYMRFDYLIKTIRDYYRIADNRRIPMFQYALYAMHQLPLEKLMPPSFPDDPRASKYGDDRGKELNAGLYRFCEEIGALLLDPELPELRKKQLHEELNHCITEWRWQELFQLCISIAQKTASLELAEVLQRRLERRTSAQRKRQPVSMDKPHSGTQKRLAQIYWNAIDNGEKLDTKAIHNLERLLLGSFCDMDYGWLNSNNFRKHFVKLDSGIQEKMYLSNPELRNQQKDTPITLDEVTRPDQLRSRSFNDIRKNNNPKKPDEQSFWNKVIEFLNNPETEWAMVDALSKRGWRYNDATKERLPKLTPKTPEQKTAWIRTLGYCRTREALQKLELEWKKCALRSVTLRNDTNSIEQSEILVTYLGAVEKWTKNAELVTNIAKDNSFDILAALCLCSRRDIEKRKYQYLLSCIVAATPSSWTTSQGNYGLYWKSLTNAISVLWLNIGGRESIDCRRNLTSAMYHLCYLAITRHPSHVQQFDQALFNFSKLFLTHKSMLKLYHVNQGNDILRLFARSILNGYGCPLSMPTQKQFMDFLSQYYNTPDMVPLRTTYRNLLVLWYWNTNKLGQSQLLFSEVFQELVGPTPSNIQLDLEAIAYGIE